MARSKVIVAQSLDAPDLCVGYFVYEPPSIAHYLYVKFDFRRFGVAKKLIEHSKLDLNESSYSHRTGDCVWLVGSFYRELEGAVRVRKFRAGKYPKATYDPYTAFI